MKRITQITLLITTFSLANLACTQSEVVVDKVVAKINEQIGKYDIQLKSAEKMLVKLKEAKRKAKINAKLSSKNGESYQGNVDKSQAAVSELESKLAKIKAKEDKGPPYRTASGKKLTKSKLNTLKVKVSTKLSVAKAKLSASQKALQVSQKSAQGNTAIGEQLDLKIAKLQGKIEILKNNIGLLNDMEEQRKLKSEFDSELAKGLLSEMDKTIAELDSIIDVDMDEVFNEPSSVDESGNNGLSNDDVDLIDDL